MSVSKLASEHRRVAVEHLDDLASYAPAMLRKEAAKFDQLARDTPHDKRDELLVALRDLAQSLGQVVGIACARSKRGDELIVELLGTRAKMKDGTYKLRGGSIEPVLDALPKEHPSWCEVDRENFRSRVQQFALEAAAFEATNAWMWVPRAEWDVAHETYPWLARVYEAEPCNVAGFHLLSPSDQSAWALAVIDQLVGDQDTVRDALAANVEGVSEDALELLATELRLALRSIRKRAKPESWGPREFWYPREGKPEGPEFVDGVMAFDAAYLVELKSTGTTGEGYERDIRRDLPANIDAAQTPWYGYLPEFVPIRPPRRLRVLAQALYPDVVQKRVEAQRRLEPVRMSSDLANVISYGRLNGGKIAEDGTTIVVDPGNDTLVMMFADDMLVAKEGSKDLVPLRGELTGFDIRTLLAMVCSFQDCGMPSDGRFSFEGDEELLDMMGIAKDRYVKAGRGYERYRQRDREALVTSRAKFRKYRVRRVGDLEALAGDALVDEVQRRGKRVYCALSRLVAGHLRGPNASYARIPRDALKLPAEDMPFVMAIAMLVRAKMFGYLKGTSSVEAPLRVLLESAGIDGAAHARKRGRQFWSRETERFARVAEEAHLGTLSVSGEGGDALLSLKVNELLRASYAPLLEKAKKHDKARDKALETEKRTPRRRRKQ